MSNQFVEGLFLLAFWAPPLAVFVGILFLAAPDSSARSVTARHIAPLTH